MSTRANRTLCSFRTLVSTPPIWAARIITAHLSFLKLQPDNQTFGRTRKHYHSDVVARFRIIPFHGRKPTNLVPHALKVTAQVAEKHKHVASAGTHNNAPDASLLHQLRQGGSDADSDSLSDAVVMREESGQNQSTPFMAPEDAHHMDSGFIEVNRGRNKARDVSLSWDYINFSPSAKREGISADSQGMGVGGSNDAQTGSTNDEFLDLQTDTPSIRAQDKTSATKGRQVSSNRNNPAVLKIRSELLKAAQVGDLHNAYKHYLEFTRLGKLDAEVADVLIRALCWGTLHAPSHLRISQALQICGRLIETEKQVADDAKGFFESGNPPSIEEQNIFTRIYNTLLRALSASLSVTSSSREVSPKLLAQYVKASMEILSAMKARGLVPDSRTACSILLLRFRSATSHEEAFEFYNSLVTELEAAHGRGSTTLNSPLDSKSQRPISGTSLLDLRGYRKVLNAFAKLSFPTVPVAPGPLWFAIAQDMRARGHVVTVEDYTIYLGVILAQTTSPFTLQRTAIGLASRDEEARMEAMMACVKHVHKRLAIDVTLDPDPTLMNTLMNVYQYLGAFDMALKVFNMMWLSGRMDNVTPVIIFDACGHAKRSHEATMIWYKLVEKGWQFDKRTLDTWVECLCRLGNVEAACKFVCMYMGRDKAGYSSKGDTRPDVQTCLILLKLSWAVGQNLDVKEKIRTHLPNIWNKLTSHYT